MKIVVIALCCLIFSMVNAFVSDPVHDFVTLDTVTDLDFASLMSKDWMQRLPEVVRKYKDQIQSKLHIAHHEHKLT
jgi:hypothetical protein